MNSKRRYAEGTDVGVEKSQGEIKALLRKAGAGAIGVLEANAYAQVVFEMQDRRIIIRMPLPPMDADEFVFVTKKTPTTTYKAKRAESEVMKVWEQACRRSWRALLLVIKAKLEAVASGIVTFEDEFLAYTMKPDGETIGDWARRALPEALEGRPMPPLLGGPPS